MSKWLSRFNWYRRYTNSYPRYAVMPISDSIIIFVPKHTFIIPLPQFWVDRNTRKMLERKADRKTEPQKNCDNCGTPRDKCVYCIEEDRMWTPKTEPQTEREGE